MQERQTSQRPDTSRARQRPPEGAHAHGGDGGQPPRRHGFFARARHNPLALIMLVLLPAGSIALIGVFLSYAGFFENLTEPVARTEPVLNAPRETVTMTSPRISRFDRKAQAYVLTAASAEQDATNPNLVLLDNIRLELRSKTEFGTVVVTAAKGSYDADAELLKLANNIRVGTSNNYNAELSSAEVYLDQGRITSAEPVVLKMPFGTLNANGLDLTDRGQTIEFQNRARMVITRARGDTG